MDGCERCRVNACREPSVLDHSKSCSYIASFACPVDKPITSITLDGKKTNIKSNNAAIDVVDDSSKSDKSNDGDNISRGSWMDGIVLNSASHISNCTDFSHASSIEDYSKELKALVRVMYASAFDQTARGGQGNILPPPNAKSVKQNSDTSQYMLCEFTSCLDNSLFKLWLGREDAIKISI